MMAGECANVTMHALCTVTAARTTLNSALLARMLVVLWRLIWRGSHVSAISIASRTTIAATILFQRAKPARIHAGLLMRLIEAVSVIRDAKSKMIAAMISQPFAVLSRGIETEIS